MRHIWICLIDGFLVRSGAVKAGDTMPLLLERVTRIFPHAGPDSVKVFSEDGRIFDSDLWFSNPAHENSDVAKAEQILVAVGVVDGHVGIKIHRGMNFDEVLQVEANTFTEKIAENMDFGIYDFSGEQLASIEDMIALIGPENTADPVFQKPSRPQGRKSSRQPPHRRARRTRTAPR